MTTTDSANSATTPGYVTTRQVAEMYGVTPSTVAKWVRAGKLTPCLKIAGTTGPMFFRPADLANLERRTTDPAA